MKIGLYFKNDNIKGVPIPDLKEGNPGIGGAEYQTLLLLQLLNEKTSFDFVLFITSEINVYFKNDKKVSKCLVGGLGEVVDYCELNCIDILITRFIEESALFAKLNYTKVIITQHGWEINENDRRNLCDISCVKHVVFSSSQSYCRYLDYDINRKSLFIYPAYEIPNYVFYKKPNKNRVVYLGSLDPIKNFHDLINAWPTVVSCLPNAHLTVIGSQKLWERNEETGPLGIASPEYERKIMKPLIDNNIVDTVEFLGILGTDKYKYIQESDIGVITMCHGETFCISALDIISLRRKLICVRKYGFLESTTGKVASNYKNCNHLAKTIIKELTKNQIVSNKDIRYIDKFNFSSFSSKWIDLINATYNNTKVKFGRNIVYIFKGGKIIRLFIKFIRTIFGISEKVNYDKYWKTISSLRNKLKSKNVKHKSHLKS